MADFTALKTAIQTYIKQNGNEEITGEKLQEILLSMVTTLGDSAINDLVTALANEVAARQNADGTLQQNITNEATARGNADTAIGGRIDDEATARANGDTALSNRLGSTITAENTAAEQIAAEATARESADTALQGLINGIKQNIDNGYVYAGIATPSSTPATGKVFYLALTAGTYTNFDSTVVSQGINILKYNGSAWSLDAFIGIDDEPTPSSTGIPKSGGIFDFVMENGSAFDISKYFASGGTLATYADLSAALTALNTLDEDYKRGGMSIKYVCTSDNKYVQYRLMADDWSINTEDWAIADEGVYVENPEFVYVKTDGEDKIVWAIKADGSIYYGAGVPQQVKDYIEQKIEELPLDEYESIVNFIGDYLNNTTLEELLSKKVDGEYVDNPEFIEAKTDANNKLIEVTKKDGTKVIYGNLEVLGNLDINGVAYRVVSNSEWLKAVVDAEDRILWAIKPDGTIYYGAGIPKQIVDYVTVQIGHLNKTIEDIEYIKQKINTQFAFSECTTIRKLIPSYYFDYDASPESINEDEYLDGVITSVPDNCKKVIFFTDSHWGGYNWTGNQGRDYEGISTPIMLYCKNRLNISNVIFGGDILMQNMPQATALLWGRRFMNNVLSAFGRSMLFVKGNHDFNQIQGQDPQYDYTSLLNYTLTYPIYTKYLNGSVVFDEELISTAKDVGYTGNNLTEISCFAKQHYYKDDHDAKVRYIIIDTGSVNRNSYLYDLVGGDSFDVLWLQYAFIYSALMSTPDGYDVVVAGHFFLNYNYGFVVTFARVLTLCKMLSAFKVKGTVSISYPSGISNLAYAGSNFNFEARKNIGKIFVLCGDSHQDASAICQTNNGVYESVPYYDNVQQSDDAILIINTMCEVCGGVMSHTGGNATSHQPMTQGTITETAFDIVAWDSEHIYCKRVGDGVDRTFNY